MKHVFSKYIFPFISFGILFACGKGIESPEETLQKLGIDQAEFIQLSECEQIKVWAEAGYKHLDMDHIAVLLPVWMYEEIAIQDKYVVSACIGGQIFEYLASINKNKELYRENSLKVHSLIYLAYDLDLLKEKEINIVLRKIVCDETVELVDENFTDLYYLTKYNKLPGDAADPNYTKKLEKQACEE